MQLHVNNRDITETLNRRECESLEDEIFLAIDKVQALSAVQCELEAAESQVARQTRTHYAIVLDEQVSRLRTLLEKHFG